MKVVRGYPPNYAEIRERFRPGPRAVFTYGDTLYSLDVKHLTGDVVRHEETHARQQAAYDGGAEGWWRRYFDDAEFRLSQEIEAYRAQWAVLVDLPRSVRRKRLDEIARTLSSRLYGFGLSHERARSLVAGTAG